MPFVLADRLNVVSPAKRMDLNPRWHVPSAPIIPSYRFGSLVDGEDLTRLLRPVQNAAANSRDQRTMACRARVRSQPSSAPSDGLPRMSSSNILCPALDLNVGLGSKAFVLACRTSRGLSDHTTRAYECDLRDFA